MSQASYQIEQIYTPCLAQGAYFIQSMGESCVIDPLRETSPYTDRIKSSSTELKYIFETHFHADFVSGHVDLAKITKAPIVFGPTAEPGFDATIAEDNQVFKVGAITLTVLHTPGHTMESSCYLLKDETGTPKALFSGDTLFIGDVGRPDLAQKATSLTQDQLATFLFNSLRQKVMTLPDDVVVYPAHGAGSACGKNMSSETSDTLGNQKKTNYALRANMTAEEFTKELTTDLPAPPTYFGAAVARNKSATGDSYDDLVTKGMKKLSPNDVETLMKGVGEDKQRPYVIDTRWHSFFAESHIPGSIYAGIEGPFGPFIASAIGDVTRPYIAVCYEDGATIKEVITRLSRFGFDNPLGYLDGGFEAWKAAGKEVETTPCMSPDELADYMTANPDTQLIDCRKTGEHRVKHHPKAELLVLEAKNILKADTSKPCVVHCGSGYRSHIFISLLRFHRGAELKVVPINVTGGMGAMEDSEKLFPQLFLANCQLKARAERAAAKKVEEAK